MLKLNAWMILLDGVWQQNIPVPCVIYGATWVDVKLYFPSLQRQLWLIDKSDMTIKTIYSMMGGL